MFAVKIEIIKIHFEYSEREINKDEIGVTTMFKTYDLFNHRSINDLVPEIIYYYLFKGLSLTAIEVKLFKTEEYKGWLSKTFLNYYGIDTEKENKGMYADKTVPEVVAELYKSSDIAHIRVAKLLKEKYL